MLGTTGLVKLGVTTVVAAAPAIASAAATAAPAAVAVIGTAAPALLTTGTTTAVLTVGSTALPYVPVALDWTVKAVIITCVPGTSVFPLTIGLLLGVWF